MPVLNIGNISVLFKMDSFWVFGRQEYTSAIYFILNTNYNQKH